MALVPTVCSNTSLTAELMPMLRSLRAASHPASHSHTWRTLPQPQANDAHAKTQRRKVSKAAAVFAPSRLCVSIIVRGTGRELRRAFTAQLEQLPKTDFIRAWCAVAYAFPGLHPDGYEDAESGWPRALRRFAAEAWRRADAGELADEELYPCDAQWAGLYDRFGVTTAEENQRRVELAARHSERADG